MNEAHLRVYNNRSELIFSDGTVQSFPEGGMNLATKARYKQIGIELASGYLEGKILICRDRSSDLDFSRLTQEQKDILNKLVQSVTSEVGRALVGLTILQLAVKSIQPEQNIRLHKGSSNLKDFSWCNGISMRSLDSKYITPVLRKYELLRLNADGFMMTRTLAENYPYSFVYKAKIKGAMAEWVSLIEAIEKNEILVEIALCYILSQLLNQAASFKLLASQVVRKIELLFTMEIVDLKYASNFILTHINESDYAARLMEISMHSLMQAIYDCNGLTNSQLKPLSQMRSANKKHGNIGDIELLEDRQISSLFMLTFLFTTRSTFFKLTFSKR